MDVACCNARLLPQALQVRSSADGLELGLFADHGHVSLISMARLAGTDLIYKDGEIKAQALSNLPSCVLEM